MNILSNHSYLVKELGDKYPFGDDEILRIGRCLAYLKHTPVALSNDVVNYSFLNNWAVYCSTLPKANFNHTTNTCTTSNSQQQVPFKNLLQVDENLLLNLGDNECMIRKKKQMKIRKIISFIEDNILPPWFGQTLEEISFALLAPTSNKTNDDKEYDDYSQHCSMDNLAMQRLEYFLNGLADSSRRGSRKALSVIYNCVVVTSAAAGKKSTSSNDNISNHNKEKEANAKDLLDLTYRLALSSLLLGRMQQQSNNNDDNENTVGDQEEEEFRNKDSSDTYETDLEELGLPSYIPEEIDPSLVQSIIDFESKYSAQSRHTSNCMYEYSNNNVVVSGSSGDGSINNSNSLIQKIGEEDDKNLVSLEAFIEWVESNAPCLAATLETFIHHIFFPDKAYPPSRLEFIFPSLRGQQSAYFKSASSPLLFTFAAMSSSLGGAWYRLFTSDEDGLSFNRLQNSLLGYGGPTLLIIKEVEGGGIFGAFTSTAWKESKDFYGDSDCFLFQLQPDLKVIRPRLRGTNNFMYCNSESRSRGYDGQAHGIGFGGTVEKPRLFIAESFDGCMASSSDLTFDAGVLLSPLNQTKDDFITAPTNRKYFELLTIEVYGVGGDDIVTEALGARNAQREIKAANIRKARKVDKAAFLDDFKSGLIESKAFKVSFFFISSVFYLIFETMMLIFFLLSTEKK